MNAGEYSVKKVYSDTLFLSNPGWQTPCLDIPPPATFVKALKQKILNPKYFAVFMKSLFEKLLCRFSVKKTPSDKGGMAGH